MPDRSWPSTAAELVELQVELAAANRRAPRFRLDGRGELLVGGVFVASEAEGGGPGRADDPVWAAAVVWRAPAGGSASAAAGHAPGPGLRRSDAFLRGAAQHDGPRRATDVVAQAVVAGRAPSPYLAGLLALRDGPVLGAAVDALPVRPDVVLVDATGLDHPRRAGLAVHLGAVAGVPTVRVSRRPLVARGELPPLRRGARAPLVLDGEVVGWWVCTRSGVGPVVAHAGWRTDPDVAAELVLVASTEAARTPVPLQEARRVAREARALDRSSG